VRFNFYLQRLRITAFGIGAAIQFSIIIDSYWPVVASQDGIVEPLFILDTPPLIK
jgi:hypothetical protein